MSAYTVQVAKPHYIIYLRTNRSWICLCPHTADVVPDLQHHEETTVKGASDSWQANRAEVPSCPFEEFQGWRSMGFGQCLT